MSRINEAYTLHGSYEEIYNHGGTTGDYYNINSSNYAGTAINDSGMPDVGYVYWTKNFYRVTTVGSDIDGDKIASAVAILGAKLRIGVGSISGRNETVRLAIGICTSRPANYQSETLHNRPATTWKTITTSGYETIEIQDVSKPQAEKILRYGIMISEASSSTSGYATIKTVSFETDYISRDTQPVIAFVDEYEVGGVWNGLNIRDDGTATWRHRIEDDVTVKLSYTQEASVALAGYKVWYTPMDADNTEDTPTLGANVVVYEQQLPDENGRITIPASVWRGLTREWRGSKYQWQYAKVRIWGTSATGKISNMLEMQMWIQLSPHVAELPAADSVQVTNDPVVMQWRPPTHGYQGFMGSVPSGFRLQYSRDEGATWANLTDDLTGTTYTYTIPAETMESGTFTWRVIAKYVNNTYITPKVSDYEVSRFVYRTNPTTSSVTCDGKPQPTVSWTSSEQKSYQVRFGDYDSGAVYSAAKSHTIPRFFADGNYPVQVRTQVASGEWSDWSETIYVAITNTAPEDVITLTAERDGDAVKLVWSCTYDSTYIQYIVYRNGVPIHKTDGGKKLAGYVDNMAVGESAYFVRGITATKNYYQSATKTVDATPVTDLLYDVEAGTYIRLRYTVSSPTTVTYSRQIGVSYQYFAGRAEPVAIVNGRIERSTTQTYGSRTRELADKIDAMTGRTVLFRDTRGGGIYGVIEQVQTVHGRIHSVTFTVREVYHNERVEYTVPGS
nr:MAG TPA: Interferon alpha/beta receptor 1, Interferon I interferon signaling complex [Caudoviricetes sp.]